MFNSAFCARLVLGVALVPGLALAASVALPPLTAAQIVEKNVAARGGRTAWAAVQAMSWKGKMGAGASAYTTVSPAGKMQTKTREEAQLPFKLEFKRPLKTRLELDIHGQTAVQVFDGERGWKLRPYLGKSGWDPYTPEELKKAAAEPGIDGLLIDYAAKGSRVETAGTDRVEDHDAYKLKVTLKDGQVRHVWLDGQSFLDIKVDGTPRRLDGKLRPVEIYLRDFKAEKGLMIPHRLETAVQGVKNKEAIQIENVTVNPNLNDSLFTKS
jgi:outer membrane lipoprotein-sorting protein